MKIVFLLFLSFLYSSFSYSLVNYSYDSGSSKNIPVKSSQVNERSSPSVRQASNSHFDIGNEELHKELDEKFDLYQVRLAGSLLYGVRYFLQLNLGSSVEGEQWG